MVGLANDLNISESGYVVHNGSGVFYGRTFQEGTGILITNPNGVAGNSTISVNTSVIKDLHTARYIVSPNGITDGANYTNISSAISAAAGATGVQTVFIQPGTYTENLTLQPNVNLAAYAGDGTTPTVTIVGKLTFTQAGSVSIGNIRLQTNSDYFLEITGANASIVNLNNCYLSCTNNTGIHFTVSNASATLNIISCTGDLSTTGIAFFTDSSTGENRIVNSNFTNTGSSTTASTKSAGRLNIFESFFPNTITYSSSSIASGLFNTNFDCSSLNATCLTTSGTGSIALVLCYFASGTASALSIGVGTSASLTSCNVNSSNTNVVTGAGTISFGGVTFSGNSYFTNTTTQQSKVTSNDSLNIRTPPSYPYTVLSQDRVVLVDSSSSRTINLKASPNVGLRHTIKDDSGLAGTNPITIAPAAGNIDGSASYSININYGSADVVYNGTQWNVI